MFGVCVEGWVHQWGSRFTHIHQIHINTHTHRLYVHTVLQDPALVQYALRLTLLSDALSSQFKLPAPGQPPLAQRTSVRGTPIVEVLLHTSVWGAAVLSAIAGDRQYRLLTCLGVAGIASSAVAAWVEADMMWWHVVSAVSGSTMFAAPPEEDVLPAESLLADEDPLDGLMLDTYGNGACDV